MDVELQILKHLPRDPEPTVSVVDEYCESYKEIFGEVRSYEYFKYLHLGIISPIKRKSFPEIAKAVGINSSQSLHHFIANSPWSVRDLKDRRLRKTFEALRKEKIIVMLNETGDKKKGNKTDYVAQQYLESVGKIDRGIVSINAYGIYKNITFPLLCKVFKPEGTLKEGDIYKSKIEIASEIMSELIDYGFKIELLLAESWDGESSEFVRQLEDYHLCYVLSTRNDSAILMSSDQRVRAKKDRIVQVHGLRQWGKNEVKECQKELGWTDYRLTQFSQIEKWWELIMSAYLMISLKSQPCLSLQSLESQDSESDGAKVESFVPEPWNCSGGWKSALNDFRVLIQPKLRC